MICFTYVEHMIDIWKMKMKMKILAIVVYIDVCISNKKREMDI